MTFEFTRRARAKRGWFRRAPEPREVGERIGRLVRRMERDAVIRAQWRDKRFRVELALHPAAPPARIVLEPDGELAVTAETGRIGPGYQAHVAARVAPLLDELDYAWIDEPPPAAEAMCAWLAGELRGGTTRFGLHHEFILDAPVLTPLGPRDAAWRDAVLADPMRAKDAFAWWDPAQPAAYSRALLALWHEVPWREPIDKPELELMEQVDTDLRAAHVAGIAVPWPEWAELCGHLGLRGERIDEIRARAGDRAATIGYRRHDMDVELSGGWIVTLPGSFVGAWEDGDARYWATDGDRAIEFTSFTAPDRGDSEQLLAIAPEQHPVIERFVDATRRGRAEAHDEDHVHVVHGLMACAPDVAILTCKGDEAWALRTWRSLRRA